MAEPEIEPIAIPGIHERFVAFFSQRVGEPASRAVLDLGCGHGALSKRFAEAGFLVSACDREPQRFRYSGVECKRADAGSSLPYADGAFDLVVAVEVTEHLHNHDRFFAECSRVLKRAGRLFITTPNILSLKSRLRFLTTGYFYSFEPLDPRKDDGLQHVAALTLDQYRYVAGRNGLRLQEVSVDLWQRSSIGLLWLWPLLRLARRYCRIPPNAHERRDLLLGRILFLVFEKA